MLRTTIFDNLTTRQIKLGIEPWGFAYDVPPEGRIEIEYKFEDDMELDFAVVGDNVAIISVSSTHLVVRSSGIVLLEMDLAT